MGIKGIYNEIGPGHRIALAKLAVDTFEDKGRPLRLAVDISIWLFQIQSGKGGTNPALRTFYYRLLRLISLAIHPLFVFDGPNKPPFKRNKRTGPNVASIPEFLAKQLLKQFGLPFHLAPGEAEAECALLQRRGVVDAVLSEDVDTLMFGSGITLRNWSPNSTTKSAVPTHVNLYDAQKIKAGSSGLDREGMILVALMSGGDYIPEGIPGCGLKTACEAARAGFGADLCKINRNDRAALDAWRERLTHELRTNESKFFRQKHRALVIPDEFPRSDVLGYYTHPAVSAEERIQRMSTSLHWDDDIDIPALRSFCADAFDWVCISGAKHFARKLAPSLLVKELRLRSQRDRSDDLCKVAQEESKLIKDIYLRRQHPSTDNTDELRISFVPLDLVPIDLDAEEPDPEIAQDAEDSEEGNLAGEDDREDQIAEPSSPRKARAPMKYDPRVMQKAWIPELFIKIGVPLKAEDYEEANRDAKSNEATKAVRKINEKKSRKKAATGGMPAGALDHFTKVSKPSQRLFGDSNADVSDSLAQPRPVKPVSEPSSTLSGKTADVETVNLSGIPTPDRSRPSINLSQQQPGVTSSQLPIIESVDLCETQTATTESQLPGPVPSQAQLRTTFRAPPPLPVLPGTPKRSGQLTIIDLMSPSDRSGKSPAAIVPCKRSRLRSQSTTDLSPAIASEPGIYQEVVQEAIPALPPSVNTRRRRSPLRRAKTIPNVWKAPPAVLDGHIAASPPPKRPSSSRLPSLASLSEADHDGNAADPHERDEDQHCSLAEDARPRTPDMIQCGPSNEIICLTSSPATPTRCIQRPISDWISPTPKRTTTTTLMHTAGHGNAASALPQAIGYDAEVRSQSDCIELEPPSQAHGSYASEAPKQVIRLRESLHGAFALDDAGTRAPARENQQKSPQRRNRGMARGGKTWRMSEVELLDLTRE